MPIIAAEMALINVLYSVEDERFENDVSETLIMMWQRHCDGDDQCLEMYQ